MCHWVEVVVNVFNMHRIPIIILKQTQITTGPQNTSLCQLKPLWDKCKKKKKENKKTNKKSIFTTSTRNKTACKTEKENVWFTLY